jgi:predicted alpha-1,2-mannosidase
MIKKPIVVLPILLWATVLLAGEKRLEKQPVDYVDPNIGGIGQLLTATVPYVQWPHGMARIAPITTPGITDRYLADKIYGFPVGPAVLMTSTGDVGTNRATYASDFDHDLETAKPYYYAVDLQTWQIRTELTATQQATYYRFTFPSSAHAHVAISFEDYADLSVIDSHTIEGSQRVFGPVAQLANADGETREYFYAVFSRPLSTYETWQDGKRSHDAKQTGDHIGFVSDLPTRSGDRIEVRVGISYIGTEQARRNLEREIPDWRFEETKAKTRAIWNDALSGITVTGGTERQRTIFYTALYRSLGRMTNITEDGQYFSGYDHKVHEAQGHDFYVDDGLWDTYRSLHPLQLLLNGKRQEDMVRSYIRMYEQSGWLNSFPSAAGEQVPMIGHHAAELILDTYVKGYRDFDLDQAYEAMRKNATQATMIPWRRGPLTGLDRVYFEKGFFPALAKGESETVPEVNGEKRQAVSVTLENSYDDWCVAQLARTLGKHNDELYFTKLAHNYENTFNSEIGFMAPKTSDGRWVQDFDAKLGGGQGGRDYFTEMDAWVYTFAVQHDIAGLIGLMGGRDAFNAKLDRLFAEQYGTSKFQFLGQFPDATGLVGLYAQGNEPSLHIPYLYDFSGQPWKTQYRVRQLMDVWYSDGPLGLPGDDDGGAVSSWYVLSAMGFYPVCPGSPVYEIGSPIFERTIIRMGNGKRFTIVANHVSARNKYIQSAELNGKPLDRAWFPHADIADGGTLVLEMADHPSLQWGRSPQEAPPSMSAPNFTASGTE